MRLDLHIHTTASDGAWSPAKVVAGALRGGLDVIAVADHDTTAAVAAAQAAAEGENLHVIPALEASSTHDGREIHVLGYFVDPESPGIAAYGKRAGRLREARMKAMLEGLGRQGIEVGFDEVSTAAGPDRVNIARPHLARVLVDRGFAGSIHEAFDRLIGDHCEAFVPTRLQEPADAVALILEGGGIPVWAHPPGDLVDTLLPDLLAAGLRGLEVYRPSHRRSDVLRLEAICRTAGLLKSGGSDWHTPDYGNVLGDFYVTGDEVEKLLEAGGL